MSETILETRKLTRSFGGLVAVSNVSLKFASGTVHAVIGPNGAGKTTLINLLSGQILPSTGEIFYKGRDITRLSADRVSRLGVGRSFQKTNIFQPLTCLENCWLAAQSRLPSAMRFFRPATSYKDVRARAEKALDLCGLNHRRHVAAAAMSYGEQRQLEIGMMLATEPDLLLLDEPLAGMGTEEALQVVDLLKRLAKGHTMILIEHDMDAVFSIADRLTVMVNGQHLATGTVDEIRANPAVQQAYLGEEEDA